MAEFRTPWDDMDLDLVPPARQVPRLKLPVPSHFLALQPPRTKGGSWEELWAKARTASDMRRVSNELVSYEEVIHGRLIGFGLSNSSSVMGPKPSAKEEEALKALRSAIVAPGTPGIDRSHLSRQCTITTKVTILPHTLQSRVLQPVGTERVRVTVTAVPLKQRPTPVGNPILPITGEGGTDLLDFNPFNNRDPAINIVDLHQRIYNKVHTLYRLAVQADDIERDITAIHFHSDITASSLDQFLKSIEELEDQLSRIQAAAAKVSADLDEAALAARNGLGFRSMAMTAFRNRQPWSGITHWQAYKHELEWQIQTMGVFSWWVVHSTHFMR